MKWLLLITSLPASGATPRMRIWRSLKASGAAVLRDGVYLLPQSPESQQLFDTVAQDIQVNQGSAQILTTETLDNTDEQDKFIRLFDRNGEYEDLVIYLSQLQQSSSIHTVADFMKQLRKLRKTFSAIAAIDFFPGDAKSSAESTLLQLENELNRRLSPNEPHNSKGDIPRLDIQQFQGRIWATRKRPWIDRLACAWLIRRFIDPQAQILWLESPSDCPAHALGFDFDGARFTHINDLVSFEVLLASFALDQAPLQRMAALVHYLDVGGSQPGEASGLEQILWGMRYSIADDHQLQANADIVFDALLSTFTNKE